MAGAGSINVNLNLNTTGFNAGIQGAGQTLANFTNQLQGLAGSTSFDSLSGSADKLAGKLANLTQIAVVEAPFVAATKAAINFEYAMRDVNSIAQVSEDSYSKLTENIMKLSDSVGGVAGPIENATALYQLYSAGITDTATAQQFLVASTKAGVAGLTDTKTAVDIATTAYNAYGSAAGNAEHIQDVLLRTVQIGKVRYDDLAQSLGRVASIAANNGVSFEELNAAIAMLTKNGISAQQASTSLSRIISNLSAETPKAEKELAKFGISAGMLRDTLANEGLGAALELVMKATNGSHEALRKLVGQAGALNSVFVLTKNNGEDFKGMIDSVKDASGTLDEAFGEQAKSLKVQAMQMKASLEEMGITIGNMLIPPLKEVTSDVKFLIDTFNNMPPALQSAFTGLAGVATSFITLNLLLKVFGVNLLGSAGLITTKLIPALDAIMASGVNTYFQMMGAGCTVVESGIAGLIGAFEAFAVSALAPVAAVTAAVLSVGWALDKSKQSLENTKYEAAQMDELVKKTYEINKAGHEHLDILSMTSKQMIEHGVTTKEVTEEIVALQEQASLAAEQGNEAEKKSRIDLIAKLREQRIELDALSKTQEEANQKQKDMLIKFNAETEELFTDFQTKYQGGWYKNKQAALDALQGIEAHMVNDSDKKEKLMIEEQKIKNEIEKENEAHHLRAEAKRYEVFQDSLKNQVGANKITLEQAAAKAREEKKYFMDNFDYRAKLENAALSFEKKSKKEATEATKKELEERFHVEVNQLEAARISKKISFNEEAVLIQQLMDRYKFSATQRSELIKKIAQLQSQGDKELEISQNKEKTRLEELAKLREQELKREGQINQEKIKHLKEERDSGINTTEQLKAAFKEQLKLKEAELNQEAEKEREQASKQINSAEALAEVEKTLQLKLGQARREAAEQYRLEFLAGDVKAKELIDNLDAAKKKNEELKNSFKKEGKGDIQSLEEMVKSVNAHFEGNDKEVADLESKRKQYFKKQFDLQRASRELGIPGDPFDVFDSVAGDTPDSFRKRGAGSDLSQKINRAERSKFEQKVKDQDGDTYHVTITKAAGKVTSAFSDMVQDINNDNGSSLPWGY